MVTDGADQNSHRSLDDLIPVVQASQAQVFVIGCIGKGEHDVYRTSHSEKVALVTNQEIDNPLVAFKKLAEESGAEYFLPSSADKIQSAVDAVAHQLRPNTPFPTIRNQMSAGFAASR